MRLDLIRFAPSTQRVYGKGWEDRRAQRDQGRHRDKLRLVRSKTLCRASSRGKSRASDSLCSSAASDRDAGVGVFGTGRLRRQGDDADLVFLRFLLRA